MPSIPSRALPCLALRRRVFPLPYRMQQCGQNKENFVKLSQNTNGTFFYDVSGNRLTSKQLVIIEIRLKIVIIENDIMGLIGVELGKKLFTPDIL